MATTDELIDSITRRLTNVQAEVADMARNGASPEEIADAKSRITVIREELTQATAQQDQEEAAMLVAKQAKAENVGQASNKPIVSGNVSNTDYVDMRVRLRAFPNTWNAIYGAPAPENIMFPLHPEAKSNGFVGTNGMVFPYTPTITETQSVNYTTLSVTHSNQDYLAYSNTSSKSLSITGQFTAQNPQEARYTLACIHFLRSVTKMRYGESQNRGLPPPTLLLSGYGKYIYGDLPVVVTSFSTDFTNDSDLVEVFIAGNGGVPVAMIPSLMNITVSVTVQQTPNKMRKFNQDKFISGELLDGKGGWV